MNNLQDAPNCLCRSWLLCTKPCRTTTCTWKALSSNPTWSLADTAAPPSTAQRRLLWRPSPPCAAQFPQRSQVSRGGGGFHTDRFEVYRDRMRMKHFFSLPCRSGFPLRWSEWGRGLHPPERHQQLPSGQTLGPNVLLRSSPAGVCAQSLERTQRERESRHRAVHQESGGTTRLSVTVRRLILYSPTNQCFMSSLSTGQQSGMSGEIPKRW